MIIVFNEGLWGLGKTYDAEKFNGFKYEDSSGRDLGELRYVRPVMFLELCKSIKMESAICDRTPYFMRILAENGFASPDSPFLGNNFAYYSEENTEKTVNQMITLESVFENLVIKMSAEHQFIFNIYAPKDINEYFEKYIKSKDENWFINKHLKSNCLNAEALSTIHDCLFDIIIELCDKCSKESKPDVNIKISKVW